MRRVARAGALSRAELAALLLLLLAAGALRWLAWLRTAVLFNDGPRFLQMAQRIAAGDWGHALNETYHPLYPAAVALTHGVVADWETAAVLVSVAGGVASVLFLFLFVRDAFGTPTDWAAAALLTVHSRMIEFSADVQSDGVYMAFFLAGMWLAWRALRTRSLGSAAAAGIAAGLAYMTRPEGLGIAVVAGGLGAARVVRGRWAVGTGLRWGTALAVGVLLCVGPYLVALRAHTGVWTLSSKRSVAILTGAELEEEAPAPSALPWPAGAPGEPAGASRAAPPAPASAPPAEAGPGALALGIQLLHTASSSLRYTTLFFLAIGLALARGRPGDRGRFVLALIGLYGVVLFALLAEVGYVSRRHTFPPLVPLIGYAGMGVVAVGQWAQTRLRAARRQGPAPVGSRAALLLGIGLMAAPALWNQIEPKRLDKLAERRAAEWLRDHGRAGPASAPVAAGRQRVGYYAGAPYLPLGDVPPEQLPAYLRAHGARYAILGEPDIARAVEVSPSLRLIHQERVAGEEAWVFELAAPAER
jgi:4-amino-4-deoxy-L-arabinose transferase-like glycosyltransferase